VTVEAVFRREYGRCVATLIRFLGDIDAAEEAVQDAFTVAAARWPSEGLPPNPGAWIVTAARNRAIDRLRRESVRDERHAQAHHLYGADTAGSTPPQEEGTVPDDRLRLIFTCCHPALNQAAQVALTLRLLGGLETPEIARAFLVPEATMAQRIVGAKRKIRDARIPYRVPAETELPGRLTPALAVVYLIFNEGYAATAGSLMRLDLCAEAIRRARVLAELRPDERSRRPQSSRSTAPSRSPKSAAPRPAWPPWTSCARQAAASTATTCSTRHALTCCAASAGTRKPRRPTTPPARSPPTRSSRLSSTRNELRSPGQGRRNTATSGRTLDHWSLGSRVSGLV